MPKHCEKFNLDRETEPHFYSGIDGSLFHPEEEKFYPNDEYCVDYFYFKDDLDPEVDLIQVSISVIKSFTNKINETRKYFLSGGDVRLL